MNFNKEKQICYSYNELIKHYVDEKFQLVHYELILDSLYMSKVKDSEWNEKRINAERLYQETKESIHSLYSLLQQNRKIYGNKTK